MASQIPRRTDLSKIPAGAPPPGVTPQFDDPPSLTPTLIGLCAFLITWGTAFAAIRLWMNRKKLGVGDAFVTIAVILSIAYCCILLSFAQYFRHTWDIPLTWYTPSYIKKLYAQSMFLGPTIFFSKEAIFIMYFEIFQVKMKMRNSIVVGMILTGFVYWTSIIIASIFCAARPGETWDPLAGSPTSKRCPKTVYWGIVQGGCAIAIDVFIFVLPIPSVLRLQLTLKRKIQVLSVFMTALIGIFASAFAEVYRVQLLTLPDDELWVQSKQLICMVVENWVAVVISCMPAAASFFRVYICESQFFTSIQPRPLSRTSSCSRAVDIDTTPFSPASTTDSYYKFDERRGAEMSGDRDTDADSGIV